MGGERAGETQGRAETSSEIVAFYVSSLAAVQRRVDYCLHVHFHQVNYGIRPSSLGRHHQERSGACCAVSDRGDNRNRWTAGEEAFAGEPTRCLQLSSPRAERSAR